eukprot:5755167-Pyramimonas_sp.AAC.1
MAMARAGSRTLRKIFPTRGPIASAEGEYSRHGGQSRPPRGNIPDTGANRVRRGGIFPTQGPTAD